MNRISAFAAVLGLLVAPVATAAINFTPFEGIGADTAALTAIRDAFRAAIGGGTTAGANGSFGGLRREINWDGVPAGFSDPNALLPNFFNVNSPRGVVFSTPGTGFQPFPTPQRPAAFRQSPPELASTEAAGRSESGSTQR